MKRRPLLIGACIVLALGGLATWFLLTFERVPRELELPPRGEARYNPLYGLGKALAAMDYEVVTRATLELDAMALAPDDVLLLGTDVRSIGARDAAALAAWVGRGGRLLLTLPVEASGETPALLRELDLDVAPAHLHARWRSADADDDALLHSQVRLVPDAAAEWDWQWQADDGVIAARDGFGDGAWLALPNLHFVAQRELRERNHAALAWRLLQPWLGDGRVHLVYAVDVPPAHVLLLRYGWPIWIPLLLALLAWLWRRSQRLGPVLPLPAPDRRALLEHIRAAGEFAFRRRRGAVLHAALKRRFDTRLAREHPALAALDDDAQVRAIAAAWKLDPAWVRGALHPADLTRADAFVASIKSLSRLQTLP